MAIKNVTVNFNIDKDLKKILSMSTGLKIVGNVLKKETLDLVSRGVSPIRGLGRFEGYKVDRASDSQNKKYYPNTVRGRYPGKRKRPVNLKLSGDYLSNIDYKIVGGRLKFGFFGLSGKNYLKYETHNLGRNKNVPQRKIIPTKTNETFTPGIVNSMNKALNNFISKELKRINPSR